MPPKSKRKKIVWNNNDCQAAVCARPEATSTWVKCDSCKGWFHIVCVFLRDEDIIEDKDWYCPLCNIRSTQEYSNIKSKLWERVHEMASGQLEFSGATIPREMFRDRKAANQFNYSTDFPPTLQDLCSRIRDKCLTVGDFRFEYRLMCKKWREFLLEDFESRVQYIEFELDDITDEVLRPEEPDPEFGENYPEPEEEEQPKQEHPVSNTIIKKENLGTESEPEPVPVPVPVPEPLIEPQKRAIRAAPSRAAPGRRKSPPLIVTNGDDDLTSPPSPAVEPAIAGCEHCRKNFSESGIYSCKRNHSICADCRLLNSGCICPVCYQKHGDRRRLAIDHVANIIFRNNMAPSGGVTGIRLAAPKKTRKQPAAACRKISSDCASQPMIMNVWSCMDSDTISMAAQNDNLLPKVSRGRPTPAETVIKQEPAQATFRQQQPDNKSSLTTAEIDYLRLLPATEDIAGILTAPEMLKREANVVNRRSTVLSSTRRQQLPPHPRGNIVQWAGGGGGNQSHQLSSSDNAFGIGRVDAREMISLEAAVVEEEMNQHVGRAVIPTFSYMEELQSIDNLQDTEVLDPWQALQQLGEIDAGAATQEWTGGGQEWNHLGSSGNSSMVQIHEQILPDLTGWDMVKPDPGAAAAEWAAASSGTKQRQDPLQLEPADVNEELYYQMQAHIPSASLNGYS